MPRSETLLCPSCRKLIHVSEPQCPYCDTPRPGLFGLTPVLQRLFGQRLDLVLAVTVACGLLFTLTLGIDLPGIGWSADLFELASPSSRALVLFGMTGDPAWARGHYWTAITAIYLHGSAMHLIFNLLFLRWLGREAEAVFGPARFFLLFTAAGVGGFLMSNAVTAHPTIGASGSVYGLLGAMAAFGRRRGGTIGRDLSRQMWALAIGMGVFGMLYGGINNWAHGGGFLVGLVAGGSMPLQARQREGRVAMAAALVALGLTALSFVASWIAWGPAFLDSLR
jgi:rhomboid protease GluP